MICQPCAMAADGFIAAHTWCAACKRQVNLYRASKKIIWHRVKNPAGGPRMKCPGSGKAPLVTGHDACTGCDCQHHPVKEK